MSHHPMLSRVIEHLTRAQPPITERLSHEVIVEPFATALAQAGFQSDQLVMFGHADSRVTAEFLGATRPSNAFGIARWGSDPARQAPGVLVYVDLPERHFWAGEWTIFYHGSKPVVTRGGMPVIQRNGFTGVELISRLLNAAATHLWIITHM